MKLKDAIRYYELTGHDIFSDLKKQKEYMKFLMLDFDLPNDFSEVIETISDNLLVLWADSHEITDETELPTSEELAHVYLTQIPTIVEVNEIDEIIEAPSRFKKEVHENKTLDLLVSIVNSEMNLQQFYELETELVIEIMNRVANKREQEAKKNKKGGKK